jgi:integrase
MRRDYLLQRPGSQNWRLRLQLDGKAVEQSLHTPDRALAEVRALPLIAAHKEKLLAKRPAFAPVWVHELKPGLHVVNGEQVFATDRELNYLDQHGAVTRTTPNGRQAFALTGGPLTVHSLALATLAADFGDGPAVRPTVATKNGDDALIETYLKEKSITGYKEREARVTWALFRDLCPGVKLANATRDDGRKLVAHLQGIGNKSASIAKKVSWLTAAVNFSIKEGKLKFNPFSSIVPKSKDSARRLPFSDDDMKLIVENLDKLPLADRLMVTILATTGMRLGEAFHIKGEAVERGIRYVMVGSKTEASLRRVPLPAAMLPLLPKAIKGALFADDVASRASLRLNRFLRRIGITDPNKVIHSFRHRAQDRLRAAECPSDIRHAILGHEERTVAAGYGEGFAVPVLKRWIDRIGF